MLLAILGFQLMLMLVNSHNALLIATQSRDAFTLDDK